MTRNLKRVILTILFVTLGGSVAIAAQGVSKENTKEDNNTVDIQGKLYNEYYMEFAPIGKIELPRILYTKDGLYFYWNTTDAINSKDGFTDEYYTEGHQKIIKNGMVQPVTYDLVRTQGGKIIADFSISYVLVYFILSGIFLTIIFFPVLKKYRAGVGRKQAPSGVLQNMLETVVIFVRDDIALTNIGPKKYLRFTPYLLTTFFMILVMNLFELVPWGESPTANITVTAALAIVTFIITQVNATRHHWQEIFWFPGVPVVIKPIMGIVEFLGLFTKPFALCIRLFANMASGKVLIFSMIGLIFVFANTFGAGMAYGTSWIWVIMTLFIYFIKLLVAFIQAYIFTILSALFIGMASSEHEGETARH